MNDLDEARRFGRLEAERYDLRLRQRESREREERLVRLAAGAEMTESPDEFVAIEGSSRLWRLQQDNERLAQFHHAVVNSKAWRLIQALRRLFGRAW